MIIQNYPRGSHNYIIIQLTADRQGSDSDNHKIGQSSRWLTLGCNYFYPSIISYLSNRSWRFIISFSLFSTFHNIRPKQRHSRTWGCSLYDMVSSRALHNISKRLLNRWWDVESIQTGKLDSKLCFHGVTQLPFNAHRRERCKWFDT